MRGCLPTDAARIFSTLLVSSGVRFCEGIGLRPQDFDFDACILEVARSVVKVMLKHHAAGLGRTCQVITSIGWATTMMALDLATGLR